MEFTRQVESLAETELAIPELAGIQLATSPAPLAAAAPDPEPIEADVPSAEATAAPDEELILDEVELPPPPANDLPPPPPADLLDLTSSDLEAPVEQAALHR